MKSSFFTFALLFCGLTAFATGNNANTTVTPADEICYTVTVNVGIPGATTGVEVTGCGDSAGQALGELIAGIDGLV
ncbi:MAG: hypothetical protein ACJAZ9_001332 [Neolewinella sp.]|jgi:hypothetical protein